MFRSIRRRIITSLAVAAAGALALAGCGGGSGSGTSASGPIVICGDLALSGPYAQIGTTDNWGATAFFKHVNATGGIMGHKVQYTNFNNQSSAAQSELIAKKCVQQLHAKFIVGPESGADTLSAADRDRLPHDPHQPFLRLGDQRLPRQ